MTELNLTGVELEIKRVTLYTSGVGYFERGGEVEGEDRRTLYFPIDQINDVLKSLTLFDHGKGAVKPVTYAAQDPMAKALQAFSVDVSDNPSRGALLNRIRGAEVELTIAEGAGKTVSGVVVGVEERMTFLQNGPVRTATEYVNIMTDAAIRTLDLSTVESVKIVDTKLAAEIRQALAAVAKGRDASRRPLTLSFSGEGRRNVEVGYVIGVPVWQTTYRLILGGKSRLQGWALVQNTGQDDWTDAQLTLVSGRPISFRQELYTPLYLTRPLIASRIEALQAPVAYESDIFGSAVAAGAPAPVGMPEQSKKASRASSKALPDGKIGEIFSDVDFLTMDPSMLAGALEASVEMTGAEMGTAQFAYRIGVPVSVPRQESAMIPFVSTEIEAEEVSVYRNKVREGNPLLGARITNSTGLHLTGGPLTVFVSTPDGEAGYAGDALIDDTEPDQKRLITFAVDLAVDADLDKTSGLSIVSTIKVRKGMLEIEQHSEQRHRYVFKNNDAKDRLVIIEHPTFSDFEYVLISPPEPGEKTAEYYRFEVPVAAGASVSFEVHQNSPDETSVSLAGARPEYLLRFAREGVCSPDIRKAIENVSERRAKVLKTKEDIDRLESQKESIGDGQNRIRKNMGSLDNKSDLYRRYVTDLSDQEDIIHTIQTEINSLKNDLAHHEDDLREFIDGLELI